MNMRKSIKKMKHDFLNFSERRKRRHISKFYQRNGWFEDELKCLWKEAYLPTYPLLTAAYCDGRFWCLLYFDKPTIISVQDGTGDEVLFLAHSWYFEGNYFLMCLRNVPYIWKSTFSAKCFLLYGKNTSPNSKYVARKELLSAYMLIHVYLIQKCVLSWLFFQFILYARRLFVCLSVCHWILMNTESNEYSRLKNELNIENCTRLGSKW